MFDVSDQRVYVPRDTAIEAMQYLPALRNYDAMIAWAGTRLGAEPTRHRMFVRTRTRSGTGWDHKLQIEVKPTDWVCIRPMTDTIFVLSAPDFEAAYTKRVVEAPTRQKPGPKPKIKTIRDLDDDDDLETDLEATEDAKHSSPYPTSVSTRSRPSVLVQ